jgi:hypothetical protein
LTLMLVLLGAVEAHRFFWNAGSSSYDAPYVLEVSPLSSYIIGELAAHAFDIFRVDHQPGATVRIVVIAPQACPWFQPELWVVAQTIEQDETPPFAIPDHYRAVRISATWQPYRDYMMTARIGPSLRAMLNETGYYVVIYNPGEAGTYMSARIGQDTFGGTREGFEAFARFNSCQLLPVD